jgi:streptogramin lyase
MRISFFLKIVRATCIAAATIAVLPAGATILYYTQPITGTVVRTDGTTTTTLISGLSGDSGVALGPDGNIYVSEEAGHRIDRYSPAGKLLGSLTAAVNHTYVGFTIAADGLLYASFSTVNPENMGYIQRFDPATFSPLGSGLATPSDLAKYSALNSSTYYEGLTQGADGNFYASGTLSGSVDVYQGPGGVSPGALIRKLSGGLTSLADTAIGPDGAVYAADFSRNQVLRYDGTAFKAFASTSLNQPEDLHFGPDGTLFVTNGGTNQILKFQGPSGAVPGAYAGVFATTSSRPSRFTIVPEPTATFAMAVVLGTLIGRRPIASTPRTRRLLGRR